MARTTAGVLSPIRATSRADVLTVLTIVGLLAALVLPLYLRAHEGSRQETCFGNLRKLTQATLLYSQDYDGYLVPASIDWRKEVRGKTWFGTVAYWPLLLYPYVGSADPYWCPSSPHARYPWGPGMEWKTYGINVHLTGRISPGTPTVNRLSDVRRPEETGVFVDSAGVCLLSAEDLVREPIKEPYLIPAFYAAGYVGGGRAAFPAHNGGMNMAYLDGHAECLPFDRVVGKDDFAAEVWGKPFGP